MVSQDFYFLVSIAVFFLRRLGLIKVYICIGFRLEFVTKSTLESSLEISLCRISVDREFLPRARTIENQLT